WAAVYATWPRRLIPPRRTDSRGTPGVALDVIKSLPRYCLLTPKTIASTSRIGTLSWALIEAVVVYHSDHKSKTRLMVLRNCTAPASADLWLFSGSGLGVRRDSREQLISSALINADKWSPRFILRSHRGLGEGDVLGRARGRQIWSAGEVPAQRGLGL